MRNGFDDCGESNLRGPWQLFCDLTPKGHRIAKATLMNFFRLLVALAARQRPVLINSSVGFTTFAAGDVLSQGTRPFPSSVTVNDPVAPQELSWQHSFADR